MQVCHEGGVYGLYLCGCQVEEWVAVQMFLWTVAELVPGQIVETGLGFDWQLGERFQQYTKYE